MKIRAFSIYDRASGIYHAPFFAVSDGAATRMFQDLVVDVNTTIGRHPSDYSLWFVGDFDDQSGLVVPCSPLHVVNADSLRPSNGVDREPLPLFKTEG